MNDLIISDANELCGEFIAHNIVKVITVTKCSECPYLSKPVRDVDLRQQYYCNHSKRYVDEVFSDNSIKINSVAEFCLLQTK